MPGWRARWKAALGRGTLVPMRHSIHVVFTWFCARFCLNEPRWADGLWAFDTLDQGTFREH
jgi:hypothetical protein